MHFRLLCDRVVVHDIPAEGETRTGHFIFEACEAKPAETGRCYR